MSIIDAARAWIAQDPDPETRAELQRLVDKNDVAGLEERFSGALQFGTAGLRGLVCSPLEVTELRQSVPRSMQLVTPGIRMSSSPADDQKRTLSPREALAAGANWVVIGRPIYAAKDPRAAAEAILESLN